jgi:hypothetical protein
MQRSLREIIRMVREAGGSDIRVSQEARHTIVHFSTGGRQTLLRIHRGDRAASRYVRMIRSQLRKVASS